MKIIFTNDFLYHSPEYKPTYHVWCAQLLAPVVKLASNLDIVELKELRNKDKQLFSRKEFYALSGIKNLTEGYYCYDISRIKEPSLRYLQSFLNKNTFIIGIELGKELKQILTDLGVPFINFWFHSWKLFDDSFFMINTNKKEIFDVLKQYQLPKYFFEFYANYWKVWIQQKGLKPKGIKDNSIIFIGQTLRDKSIEKNGKFLNILDYKEKLQELSKIYSHIYYVPHPYVSFNKDIEKYIKKTPYISKINNIPTYYLLASDKVKKVIGISSSVLYEAHFFGKEVEYLFQPLFNIDQKFEDDTFISIYGDYFNPKFWKDILEKFTTVNDSVPDRQLFFNLKNKFRNIQGSWYGYEYLNEQKIFRRELNKYNIKFLSFAISCKEIIKYASNGFKKLWQHIRGKNENI